MHFWSTSVSVLLLSPLVLTANIPRVDLEVHNNIAACKNILVALRASAFCSSFVPIKDVTSTRSIPGPVASTQITVTSQCLGPRAVEERAPSTTPRAPSTTPQSTRPNSSSKTATTTTKVTTTSRIQGCSSWGLPSQLGVFGCDVIREACIAFVKPRTITTDSGVHAGVQKTTYLPPSTKTGTVTNCGTTPSTTKPSGPHATCDVSRYEGGLKNICENGTECVLPVRDCYVYPDDPTGCEASKGPGDYAAIYDPQPSACVRYTPCC